MGLRKVKDACSDAQMYQLDVGHIARLKVLKSEYHPCWSILTPVTVVWHCPCQVDAVYTCY